MHYFSILGLVFCAGFAIGGIISVVYARLRSRSDVSSQLLEYSQVSKDKKPLSKKSKTLGFFKERKDKKREFLIQAESLIHTLKNELQQKEKEAEKKLSDLKLTDSRLQKQERKLVAKLERLSGMTRKEAKSMLLDVLESEAKIENQRVAQKMEAETRKTSKQQSLEILVTAMQRHLADQVTYHSSSIVHLPSDEIKGRIIGKEGRNIKALEMSTGMEFIIGDIPEIITLSGFNPVRREIAKRALNLLIQDGRINPTRIEEIVKKCEVSMNEEIEEFGNQAVVEFGLHNVHPEIINLLGKLYFRTSYTQNIWHHSREVASLAKMIGYELGLDVDLIARCGLFHDIGKSVSSEVEGSHAAVGARLARQYGESDIVVNAIAAHHQEIPHTSIYGPIIAIADAISASRPGARRESLSGYIQRLEQLEEIAINFEGVKKCYAFQAGREIRVIVDEESIDDAHAAVLARDIANKIEDDVNFPGQIKINVIRESRVIEYAK